MADLVVIAELALVPRRVLADAHRRLGGRDHLDGFVNDRLSLGLVVLKALGVNVVVVFVDDNVDGAGAAVLAVDINAPFHVHLHLRVVFGLGLLYSGFLHFGKHLGRCGLDLQHVR